MITFYLCFLAGGVVLPLISFIMGSLSDGIDTDLDTEIDISTDISTDLSADIGTNADIETGNMAVTGDSIGGGVESMFSIGLIPTSLLSLSALTLTFGGVGSVMTLTDKNKIITFVMAIIVGYCTSVIVQTLIKSLKKIQTQNSGINENELLLYDGKIVDTILPGRLGTVSFVTLKNELVSYPARCSDRELKLQTGKIVKAIEIKDGVFVVEPKNKYDK